MPHTFIAQSAASRELLAQLGTHTHTEQPLWIWGPSGSGRGQAARWLHHHGPRATQPCLEVDGHSLDADHIGSWICGAQPGAVRGLYQARPSWFESTQGGTLVLHGIERLPPNEQLRLAQVLHAQQVQRLGARTALPIDSRLILLTDTPPDTLVQQGHLTPSLAQALRGPTVRMPTLAERPDDVPALAHALLAHHARMLQRPVPELSHEALAALSAHPWPDNLRELDTCMQSLLVHHQGQVVDPTDLGLPTPRAPLASHTPATQPEHGHALHQLQTALKALLEAHPGQVHALVQAALFEQAHHHTQGHQIKAAQVLGVSRNVLRTRLIELGILQARG